MGLSSFRFFPAFILFGSATCLCAAPMLRLVSATIGPVSVAAGGSTPTQIIEAYNAGDGSLALSLKSSAPWIVPSLGASRACTTTTAAGNCIPIQLALSTSGLPAGLSTGIVTVSDPKAVDAPQTITVTVRVGGVDVYAAPGTERDAIFTTTKSVQTTTNTKDGMSWLSVVLDGTGSFRFSYPYRIRFQPPEGMATGVYTGSVMTGGSSTAADNQTIPVTMRVTTQPIAQASPESLSVRLAQGAPAITSGIALGNLGQGTIAVQSVNASGSGIKATQIPGGAAVTFDAASLDPGVYSGSVSIASNAVNGTVTVPVAFEVVAKSAPAINYQGVVDNAIFQPGDTVARGDVMVIMGDQLSFAPLTVGKAPPLDTQVGGATVLVNGKPAPMYYSSYGQLAFQMPVDTPLGTVLVQVQRDELTSNTVSVQVADRAPRLLLIGTTGYGAIQNTDYSIPMPTGAIPGVLTHPAKVGDTLTIYAIGMGTTNPAVPTGAPAPAAEPFARLVETPSVVFGSGIAGIEVTPSFAGLTPTFAGLYQINATIPEGVPKGPVDVRVGFPNGFSNTVRIVIE